ncbi:MAG: autotransporter domain-containing protein, partial [Fusobacterium ulcerans]
MIEKIMKAVKSGNKKRGRNITIGAVVGMLLSCTVVMGADVTAKKLEITKDGNGNIEFKNESGESFTPESEDEKNPYPDNNWNASTNTYTNNSVISGKTEVADPSSDVYEAALKVTAPEINLVNNGVIKEEITVTGTTNKNGYGYGIYIASDLNGSLTNNGEIAGSGTYNGYGIYVGNLAGKLTNNGNITASGSKTSFGIYIKSDLNGNLTNNGEITAAATDGRGYGIYVASDLNGNLTNNGIITIDGYGIYVASKLNGNLTNNGIINTNGATSSLGIRIARDLTGNLTNNRIINDNGNDNGRNSFSYGIYAQSLNGSLANNGIISGTATTGNGMKSFIISGIGIRIVNDLIDKLINNGIIIGTNTGTNIGSSPVNNYGININALSSSSETSNITNTGVVFGKTYAIKIDAGTLKDLSNYGLLVTGGDKVIDGTVASKNNYGLAFKVDGTTYLASDDGSESDFS